MPDSPDVLTPKKRGSRSLAVVIPVLIVLFFIIDYFIRGAREFSPTKVTGVLLWALQFIVLLLALILLFVLGRNLARLYLERKRKVVGSHFKTKLVFFFTALAFIPTFLLLVFAGTLLNRNVEQWFKLDYNRILEDTKAVADGFYVTTSDLTLHYAQQLGEAIQRQNLGAAENRAAHARCPGLTLYAGHARFCTDKAVRVGSRLRIHKEGLTWEVRVTRLPAQRGPAAQAALCYQEEEDARLRREAHIAELRLLRQALPPQPQARPTKRDRRLIQRFTGQ